MNRDASTDSGRITKSTFDALARQIDELLRQEVKRFETFRAVPNAIGSNPGAETVAHPGGHAPARVELRQPGATA